jgi:hypothetical protein
LALPTATGIERTDSPTVRSSSSSSASPPASTKAVGDWSNALRQRAIERVIDLALRDVPGVAPGILYLERQFGVLEVHSSDLSEVRRAGEAILQGAGAKAADQLRPQVLFHAIIEDMTDQHAVILNRNRQASMILPGQALLV